MISSNTYFTKSLTTVHCFTFNILLLLSAFALTFTFIHTVITISNSLVVAKAALLSVNIIVPIYSLLLFLLGHLLEMVQSKILTTLNCHLSVLVLSTLLFGVELLIHYSEVNTTFLRHHVTTCTGDSDTDSVDTNNVSQCN